MMRKSFRYVYICQFFKGIVSSCSFVATIAPGRQQGIVASGQESITLRTHPSCIEELVWVLLLDRLQGSKIQWPLLKWVEWYDSKSKHNEKLIAPYHDQCWLVVSARLKNISQNANLPQVGVKIKNISNHHLEWLFLVPIKGGRWHTIPQLAVYTTYIPLIYCLLGGYMLPTTFNGNWGVICYLPPLMGTKYNHWHDTW